MKMSKKKIANSYAVVRVGDGGSLTIEQAGFTEARKVKNAVNDAAKANPGVMFIDVKIGVPVQYKQVISYELVNADIVIDSSEEEDGDEEGSDVTEVTDEVESSTEEVEEQEAEEVEEEESGGADEASAEETAETESSSEETESEENIAPEVEAVSSPSVQEAEAEAKTDSSDFDALFSDPSPGQKPAEEGELF